MAFDLDLCAVRGTAKHAVATTGYAATVATVATVATKTTGQDPANPAKAANPANSPMKMELADLLIPANLMAGDAENGRPPLRLAGLAGISSPANALTHREISRISRISSPTLANLPTDDQPNGPKNPELPQHAVATVATVATVASSHRPATHQKTTQKPELSHLMALAMAYCHQIGASDKARKDWQADIEATPPDLREDLAGYLQGHLPRKLPPSPLVPTPKPMPFFSVLQPWRIADRDYQNHHWGCDICKNIHAKRCEEGERLYGLYRQAADSTQQLPIKGQTK